MGSAYPNSATAHNRDLALQKYMVLYSQHQSLREHLDQLRPLAIMTSCTTAVTPPTHSPERSPLSPDSATFMTRGQTPSSAYPGTATNGPHRLSSTPVSLESPVFEMAAEEKKLFNVNECMKRTLTELLNCGDARSDPNFRMWVQCRLMETEKELRTERRRRSSSGMD